MQQRPRHAEVDDQRTPGFEANDQVLPTPVDGRDPLLVELARNLHRVVRTGEPRVGDLDALEQRPSSSGASRRRTVSTSGSSGIRPRYRVRTPQTAANGRCQAPRE